MNHDTQEISLRLEHYDDIFSDFDVRPYSKRALSVDFLDEIKRASKDKNTGGIDLSLSIPEISKNEENEKVIKERLKEHFSKHYLLFKKDKNSVLTLGLSMIVLGVIFMALATIIVFENPSEDLFMSFLIVFLEPAAWFLLWEGMDRAIFNSKSIKSDLDFYKKMSDEKNQIYFNSY